MNKFQQWLQEFMRGRAGSDELGFALLITGIVLMVFGSVLGPEGLTICTFISIALFVTVVARSLSKDIVKRRAENQKFQAIFKAGTRQQSDSIKQAKKEQKEALKAQKKAIKEKSKTHVMFYCPDCKASCWVPKNKGKVRITCPKCGSKFIGKT